LNALLIADARFAHREAAMLSRLETGLADEGVQVVRAVPARCGPAASIAVRTIEYQDRGLGLTRGLRAGQLVSEITDSRRPAEGPIDVVHAFGDWPMAAEVARRLRAGLAYEVWCAGLCARATAAAARAPALLLAPDQAVERALFRQGVGASVRTIPWGVPVPAQPNRILEKGRTTGVMVVGSGTDRAAFAAAIEGLARAIQDRPEVLVFVDSAAARQAAIWPLVRRLGLVERITLAPDMEALRRLSLAGDVLVLPEALGEHRSLVLEAMACGLAVVAAADPMVSHLADRRTCRLVAGADPPLWADTLREILDDATGSKALAASARQYVSEQHRVGNHVGLVLDAYEWLTSRDSLPMRHRMG
jgi:glycosyltransferase involved in cell wall biosynthesis